MPTKAESRALNRAWILEQSVRQRRQNKENEQIENLCFAIQRNYESREKFAWDSWQD